MDFPSQAHSAVYIAYTMFAALRLTAGNLMCLTDYLSIILLYYVH